MSINKIMLAEPIGDVNLPVKSPTEVVKRSQDWVKLTGSAFGRLHYEFVIPLLRRLLYILEELGLVDMDGYKVDGQVIDIQFESPLVQGEREEDFQRVQLWISMLAQMYGQELLMGMAPPDKVASVTAELLGVPLDIVPSTEEFEEIKANIAAQLQQQQQAQMQQQAPGGGQPPNETITPQ